MLRTSLALGLALACVATSAAAQGRLAPVTDRPFSLQGGVGFTLDPGGFLIGLEGAYQLNEDWSIGPRLKIAFDDDLAIVAGTANLRYSIDLEDFTGSVSDFTPFVQVGLGGSYIEKDDRPGSDDDSGLLVTFGGGVEARLTDELSLMSTMEFNIHPDDVLNENVFFSWEVAALRVRF